MEMEKFVPIMLQVYDITERKEIKGRSVPNDEKIFSIYERHTDIIVKGGRKVEFGHKIDLVTGKSNLVLGCDVLRGNPRDTDLYRPMMDGLIENYRTVGQCRGWRLRLQGQCRIRQGTGDRQHRVQQGRRKPAQPGHKYQHGDPFEEMAQRHRGEHIQHQKGLRPDPLQLEGMGTLPGKGAVERYRLQYKGNGTGNDRTDGAQ